MGVDCRLCSGLILAGGKSRRMGCCKALLSAGEQTFLAHIAGEMDFLAQLYLSANRRELGEGFPGACLADAYRDCGPLAGIHRGLEVMTTPYLLCVPCDMPGVTRQALEMLLHQVPDGVQAMVCVDAAGQVHPLLGVYAKSLLPRLGAYLERGGRSVQGFLDEIACQYLHAAPWISPQVLANLNTPQEYRKWLEGQR